MSENKRLSTADSFEEYAVKRRGGELIGNLGEKSSLLGNVWYKGREVYSGFSLVGDSGESGCVERYWWDTGAIHGEIWVEDGRVGM